VVDAGITLPAQAFLPSDPRLFDCPDGAKAFIVPPFACSARDAEVHHLVLFALFSGPEIQHAVLLAGGARTTNSKRFADLMLAGDRRIEVLATSNRKSQQRLPLISLSKC
jgi:hypothetical protein